MKKIALMILSLMAVVAVQAQTVSRAAVDQYNTIAGWPGESFASCSKQLEQWGFTYNSSGVINMFTMEMRPFVRPEGDDTVGVVLSVIDEVVCSVSGIYSSATPEHTFALIAEAATLQQRMATERGLAKFVCSVKGKVSNKFPKNTDELVAVLAEATAETVSDVYVTWRSANGRQVVSLIYDNKLYGKKKPRATDRADLTLGLSVTPERQ